MAPPRQETAAPAWRQAWWLVLIVGTSMQIWFWLRSVWIYLDQVDLYRLGMALARDGELVAFGKLSTGGLPIPGVLLELLIGLPLMIWEDLRASTLVLILFHLTAVLIYSRVLKEDFSWQFATVFLAIFWLSPWRLFHSAFLWETNYLLLPAALHLAACRSLRAQARFGASALLAATLLLTLQMHASALILILACGILWFRKRLFLDWVGIAMGLVAGSITLLPTFLTAIGGTGLPARPEAAGGLLLRLNSVEKGLLYWFRLGSLDVGRRFRQSLYCTEPGGGDAVPQPILCHLVEITQILALASVLVAVLATWWFLRQRPEPLERSEKPKVRGWYRDYTLAMLLAVLVSSFSSPVLIQGWHVLIALPTACIPVAAWIVYRWPSAGSSLRAVIALFLLWRIPASLLLLGHPMYAEPASPDLPRHVAPVDLRPLVPDGSEAMKQ